MKYTILILFAITTFLFSSCKVLNDGQPIIKQGVYGKVSWKAGNVMPSVETPNTSEGSLAKRNLMIYEVAKTSDVEGQSPLFTRVKTKFLGYASTDAKGYYEFALAPGTYSIFTVEENEQLFASLSNGKGEIASFEVKPREVTRYDIVINYKAAF